MQTFCGKTVVQIEREVAVQIEQIFLPKLTIRKVDSRRVQLSGDPSHQTPGTFSSYYVVNHTISDNAHRPLPRRHGLRHSGTPANEYPAHHEEDLAPAVDEDLLVGVGPAAILHSVVTSPPVPEDSLLAEDYEHCTRKREEQRLPAPKSLALRCSTPLKT